MSEIELNVEEINAGERIYPKAFNEAALDHKERYELALNYINRGDNVLDVATGVGYGANYIAVNSLCDKVIGVDISDHAINWAEKYFHNEKIDFVKCNLLDEFIPSLDAFKFDVITCFETLEHIENDEEFIKKLYSLLKPGGLLLISSPNEEVIPCFENPFYEGGRNPHHVKHYTPYELKKILEDNKFKVIDKFSQCPFEVIKGDKGFVIIYLCSNDHNIESNVLNPIDKAILELNVLQMRRIFPFLANFDSESVDFTFLDARLKDVIKSNESLMKAYNFIENRDYNQSFEILLKIDKSLCPESYFWLGLLYQKDGNLLKAVEVYSKLLNLDILVNPIIIENTKERLAYTIKQLID